MEIFIMVTLFMLSLSLLIILHEGGHFAAAKYFNTKVEKFYLFFDPKFSLYSKQIGETEYGIGWLPLGGYVKIAGMIDESMDTAQLESEPQPWEFRSKPAWQRMIIILAGVIVNFLLGFMIYAGLLYAYGEAYLTPEKATYGIYVDSLGTELGLRDGDKIIQVGEEKIKSLDNRSVVGGIVLNSADKLIVDRNNRKVELPIDEKWINILSKNGRDPLFGIRIPTGIGRLLPNNPAEQAGLKKDDIILNINSSSTRYLNEFLREIKKHKSESIELTLLRNNRDTIKTSLTPSADGTIGFYPAAPASFLDYDTKSYSLLQSLPAGVKKGINTLNDQIKAFGQMFNGKIKAKDSLGGPITIARIFPRTWDWPQFWNLTALLSLILGFMNLLPIPALDGGHAVFILYEMVSGRKPSEKVMQYTTIAGMAILLTLMVYIIGLDISRLF